MGVKRKSNKFCFRLPSREWLKLFYNLICIINYLDYIEINDMLINYLDYIEINDMLINIYI